MNLWDFLNVTIKLDIPRILLWSGVLFVAVGFAIRGLPHVSLKKSSLLGWVGLVLIILGLAYEIGLPSLKSGLRPVAANLSSDEYRVDSGLIQSIAITDHGGFQVLLKGGFPNSKAKWNSDDPWAIGDDLPDVMKQAIIAAKTSQTEIRVVTRGIKNGKYILTEVYIGRND